MNDEAKGALTTSFLGAVAFMWVAGGVALILASFEVHWALGWLALFVWVWGCWAAALYFNVQRFFP
jgi:hypothetical protein